MTDIVYLAYGSNLHPLRLRQRVPSCKLLGSVSLPGYRLVFHKIGMDDSGKCDLMETGYPDDTAWGVLYRMAATDKPALDAAEGPGYLCTQLHVVFGGERVEAMSYLARPERQDPSMVPFDWYRELVLIGAHLHDFPVHYLEAIRQVPTRPDPVPERARVNAALLKAMRSGR